MAKLNTDYYQGEDRYSDGDVEERILELVQTGTDPEEAEDRSFPVLYHLSPVREGILSWYPFRAGARVLDIGAGPGAIDGLLCRRCGEVTCVDLSLRRCRINYERHRDCGNLTILAGNLNDMTFPEPFDYVILNGVFEYAGSFTEGPDPYGTFLKRCLSYLKPDGVLLVAIENRLGLKYFSGAPEDHTDNYMDGLKDYPDNTSVHTFSRAEWEALAVRCGALHQRFYYPYPDYKFPSEIFTDETLTPDRFRRNAWNFNPRRVELFPEAQMAASLAREGIMERFMNSFLIELCRETPQQSETVSYAKLNYDRAPAYRIQTVIGKDAQGRPFVRRSALAGEAQAHLNGMWEREQRADACSTYRLRGQALPVRLLKGTPEEDGSVTYPFLTGQSLGTITAEAAKSGDAEGIRFAVRALYELIRAGAAVPGQEQCAGTEHSSVEACLDGEKSKFVDVYGPAAAARKYETVCPANIDLIFDNLILQGEELFIIDAEWVFDFPVPVLFILWRAVYELYAAQPQLEQVLPQEALLSEFAVTVEDRRLFWKWASHFERSHVGANRLAAYAQPVRKADLNALAFSGEEARLTATLYLDRGRGFCEEDAVHTEVLLQKDHYAVTFEVEAPETVTSMRFDPLEGVPCVCELTSTEAELIPANSSAEHAHSAEFLTQDPAYLLRYRGTAPAVLRISGRVQLHDLAWALARSQAHLRRSPGGALRALKRKIRVH